MSELREIIRKYNCCGDCSFCNYSDGSCDSAGGKIWDNAVKDIKKWAKGCVPERATKTNYKSQSLGYNLCRAETLENIGR